MWVSVRSAVQAGPKVLAMPAAALNPLGKNFDPFLYAQVGDDQQGGLLSVLSALARVGVDPWEQAAALARLPLDAAVRALSALLAKLPAGSGKPADPTGVAVRLVALLPRGPSRIAPHVAATVLAGKGTVGSRVLIVLLYVIALLVIGSQFLTLTQHRLDDRAAPSSGAN